MHAELNKSNLDCISQASQKVMAIAYELETATGSHLEFNPLKKFIDFYNRFSDSIKFPENIARLKSTVSQNIRQTILFSLIILTMTNK